MPTLLEVPAVREQVQMMPVEAYHRLADLGVISEKVELLRGILVKKMAKSPLHEFVAQTLLMLLMTKVPPGFVVRPERPLTFRDSEPEPDISIVRGKVADWAHAHPATAALVIEIAVSSLLIDEEKAEIYAEAGVPEYWVVRPEEREMDIYREPTPTGYRKKITASQDQVARCESIPGVEVKLLEIFPAQ